MAAKELVWEHKESFGCEYARISYRQNTIHAESTAIYLGDTNPVQIDYQLDMDLSWKTKKVRVHTKSNQSLELHADGTGKWLDRHGMEVLELSGAIDVDLSATPFSNSLPVNRLDWKLNQKRDFEMVYISIPDLKSLKMKQSYTFIERNGATRFFRYQSPNFESLISVDEEGFVIDYPPLFSRRF